MTLAEPTLLLKQFGLHISYGVDRLFDGDPLVLVETQTRGYGKMPHCNHAMTADAAFTSCACTFQEKIRLLWMLLLF
jgi:hypothetical protein